MFLFHIYVQLTAWMFIYSARIFYDYIAKSEKCLLKLIRVIIEIEFKKLIPNPTANEYQIEMVVQRNLRMDNVNISETSCDSQTLRLKKGNRKPCL